MKSTRTMIQCAAAVVLLAGLMTRATDGFSQTQGMQGQPGMQPAGSANSGICGNQPLCFEGSDFAATITDFRTSALQDGWGTKIIDATMHFQNKTNQPLSLGYVDGSGSALDDRGNRYGLNTNGGGVRGMGVVSGNTMNPQFTLQPGGGGDARFELWWHPGSAIVGQTFEVDLDVREINRVEGNQYVLGNDTLMHYQGLVNGAGTAPGSSMAGGAPGQTPSAAQGQPCPSGSTTGGSNPVQQGSSGISSAISSISSALSNHQNAATTASNVAGAVPGAVPCMQGASGLVNGIQSAVPAASGYVTPQNTNGAYGTTNPYGNQGAYGTQGVNGAQGYGTQGYGTQGVSGTQGAYGTSGNTGAYGNSGVAGQPVAAGKASLLPAAKGAVSPQPAVVSRPAGQPVPASKVTVMSKPSPISNVATAPAAKPAAANAAKPAANAKKPLKP